MLFRHGHGNRFGCTEDDKQLVVGFEIGDRYVHRVGQEMVFSLQDLCPVLHCHFSISPSKRQFE